MDEPHRLAAALLIIRCSGMILPILAFLCHHLRGQRNIRVDFCSLPDPGLHVIFAAGQRYFLL
ncbi:hypothetical protein KCP75_06185 [Salmonella enterica subsp. enterica]|nr:hypothetical protein KCP75_06185 [Salmonella enterica subsp. enterica]